MINDKDFFTAYDNVLAQMEKWVNGSKIFLFNVHLSLMYAPYNHLLYNNIKSFKDIITGLEKILISFKGVHEPLVKCKFSENIYLYDCYKQQIDALNLLISEHKILLNKHEVIKNNLENYKSAEAEGIVLNIGNAHDDQQNEFLSVIFVSGFEPLD
ncbi:hypothetical protein NF27_FP00250 [Candidatus Jidaibacter acanthamoeba]|uniref:Uncharacterized protein n=1 Tax=Candidatus Jidaibacter acanthamoebae TaxID=86105 RepID=A0A0C1QGZ2_9RICK|nr:hypothetical protein [Candidatus Jidaibacter acanthamoeba]KIE04834.1 hypothetical protein NF27_FP00250 [Candidatus Jidaibacter acanthamoeba]